MIRSGTLIGLLIALLAAMPITAQNGVLVPWMDQPFSNAAGTGPNALGTITSYVAGTTTPRATYTAADLSATNANPLTLDSDGRSPYGIWIGAPAGVTPTCYKFVIKNASGTVLSTIDNVCDPRANATTQVGIQGQSAALLLMTTLTQTQVSLVAGSSYQIGATVFATTQTGGLSCKLNGGSVTSTTFRVGATVYTVGATASVNTNPFATVITQGLSSATIGSLMMHIDGYIDAATSGTLIMACGPRTVDGTTTTILDGTYLRASKQVE